MIRRMFWVVLGAVGAVSGNRFVKRKVAVVQAKLAPGNVATQAVAKVRKQGERVRDAVQAGRDTASATQVEMRNKIR